MITSMMMMLARYRWQIEMTIKVVSGTSLLDERNSLVIYFTKSTFLLSVLVSSFLLLFFFQYLVVPFSSSPLYLPFMCVSLSLSLIL